MEDREFDYINVIPLVDIMLVLLTIVLTTATFMVQGEIPVNLPSAESAKQKATHEVINISIDSKGKLYFQGKETDLDSLKGELLRMSKETQINIRADKKVELEAFIKVIDLLNSLGMKNVSVVVLKE